MVYTSLLLLAFGIIIIYKSSEWVIRYSVYLSKILGVSTLVIGFILVSISTSLPEIFVTLFAGLEGEANLAVGNILGSNLFDLNIIIGLTTLFIGSIYMKRKETLHLIELLFITSAITMVIFSIGRLTILHGVMLLMLFSYMIMKLYRGGKIEREILEEEIPFLPKERRGLLSFLRKHSGFLVFLKFLLSIAVLLGGTKILVDSAIDLAAGLGITTAFLGATVVALGTSIPELSVSFAAVNKKHYALAMGDLLGSAVTNITLVFGILSIINPVPLDMISIAGILPFLVISTLLVWYSFSRQGKITKKEGIILLLLYAGFILEQMGVIAVFR
jgi:cation:H+ antiporter